MIDNKKAKENFKSYVEKFDENNEKIAIKIAHSYKVAEISKELGEKLDENYELTELIGQLHDIGRFEQVKRYGSFDDLKTIDHANLGVEILKDNNFIAEFCDDEQYYNIIYTAIENHNKYKIADDIVGEELVQSKIIRDADKIDILRVKIEKLDYLYGIETNNSKISEEIYESFLQEKQVIRQHIKTKIDRVINSVGFIFDINYNISFKILNERNYINLLLDKVKDGIEHEKVENIRKIANKYIEKHI